MQVAHTVFSIIFFKNRWHDYARRILKEEDYCFEDKQHKKGYLP